MLHYKYNHENVLWSIKRKHGIWQNGPSQSVLLYLFCSYIIITDALTHKQQFNITEKVTSHWSQDEESKWLGIQFLWADTQHNFPVACSVKHESVEM